MYYCHGFIYWGDGGEAPTPNTISPPPQKTNEIHEEINYTKASK